MFTHIVGTLNSWVVSLCQLLALFVIVMGIVKALIIYGRHIFTARFRQEASYLKAALLIQVRRSHFKEVD